MVYLLPPLRTVKPAKRVMRDSGVKVFEWNTEAGLFVGQSENKGALTLQNIRGRLKRRFRKHGLLIDFPAPPSYWWEAHLGMVVFRYHEMPARMMPKQKAIPVREFVPPEQTSQLEMQLELEAAV